MSHVTCKNWLTTWVTPIHDTKISVLVNGQKVENSSSDTQLLVEIQVLRSRQYWYRHATNDSKVMDVWQDDEPVLVKLFPINLRDLLSASGVFSNYSSFIPVLSIINDYCGDQAPTNFIPSDFVKDLEQKVFVMGKQLAENIDDGKLDLVSIVIPIQVVRVVVEVLHVGNEEKEEQGEEEEDKVEGIIKDSLQDDYYCDCDECFLSRHNIDTELVYEIVSSNSVIPDSSLFAGNLMKFNSGDQGEENEYACPICLREFENGISNVFYLPCSHVFHTQCITRWFVQDISCPLCRGHVQPQNTVCLE